MLLIMALALLVVTSYIEFKIIRKCPPIRWLNQKSWFLGFIMSMALSLALGWLFGLSGLVAGMAGIGSTAVTDPVHAINRKRANDSVFAAQVAEVKDTYRPVLKLLKYTVMIPFIIFMIPVKVRRATLALNPATP